MFLRKFPIISSVLFLSAGNFLSSSSDLVIEELPVLTPDLPTVPTIPTSDYYPISYEDNSLSIHGLRTHFLDNLEKTISIRGYIVDIYSPPTCDPNKDSSCKIEAPHMWLADNPKEKNKKNMLIVIGYALNHKNLVHLARKKKSSSKHANKEQITIPITGYKKGDLIQFTGRFTRTSPLEFVDSNGLLVYHSHRSPLSPPSSSH